jgi:O-antigen/teichoic acid export membrane protein
MAALLRRLLASTAAYQASSVVSSLLALVTIRLYTSYLTDDELGYAETLLTAIILASIVLRFGIGEAFVRFWFDDEDPVRRRELARTATAFTLYTSTATALVGLAFVGPLQRVLLPGLDDTTLMAYGLLGLWAFTNLEIAYALLRVEERRRAYLVASLSNVLLTVALTITLVVILDEGARGYVLGNYAASTVVLLGLLISQRDRVSLRPPRRLQALLAFGAPTIPADAAAFALNVIDRNYLIRAESPGAAGQYALAAKLSTIVIVAVRGFQAAWPPLAYSLTDPEQAARLYARVTTAYVAVTGIVVCGVTLVARYAVHLLAGKPEYYPAQDALPWVALGWAMYGLVVLLITVAGRAKVTTRNFPATLAGLVANVILLVTLVGPFGIAGAGIALAGSYVVILVVLHLLTRRLFHVPFERGRLVAAVVSLTAWTVTGALLLPETGATGLVLRLAWLAGAPVVLVAARVITPAELQAVAQLRRTTSAC